MTVKIGLLGCGGIAYAHARGYLKVAEHARVTAVSDVVEASTAEMARFIADGGGETPRCFTDFKNLLAQAEVDAVDICLPHHLHRDAIVAAAAAGKHILCEKPLCTSLEQATEIERIIGESGVTLMCAHNQLFEPAIRRARALLDEGVLGKVYEVRTVDTFRMAGNPIAADWGWRGRRETMGGGELIDTGYHPSYMLLYLSRAEPVEVTAMVSRYAIEAIEGEDSAQVLVRFADGSLGNIVSSWAYEFPAGSWQFQVIGARGQLYGRGHQLYYKPNGFEPATLTLPEVNGYHAEVADFVACLREKRVPIQTEKDGINVLKVILGAYQSEAEKRTIQLR
ncbi:MAG: Gfo/Idh/MocA family oxidoreductase [Chloroflexota bacterium]